MGMQPILSVTVSIKKIKGTAHHRYVTVTVTESFGVNRPSRAKQGALQASCK